MLIEGAGGWLSPLTDFHTVADLAQDSGHPVLIVARTGLGTINQTLLTVESVRARGLHVAGIILNDAVPTANDLSRRTNSDEIESRTGVPVLGICEHGNATELHREHGPVTMNWLLLASDLL